LTLMEIAPQTETTSLYPPFPNIFPTWWSKPGAANNMRSPLGEPDDSERNSSVFDTNPQAQPETHMQGEAICLALKAPRIFYKGEDDAVW
jgi:hypothetical protein